MDDGEAIDVGLATLASRARAGDSEAIEHLLVRLVPDGHRLAFAMLHDSPAAEDVVQNACVKAWRKFNRLHDGTNPKPWFLGIVANECRSFRRSRWALVVTTVGLAGGPAPNIDVDADAAVRWALTQLSIDDRVVLVLRYYLDMTAQQTADVLHISAAGVRTRAHRASRRFKTVFARTNGDSRG